MRNVLVFEDDVMFSADAVERLRPNIEELKNRGWKTLYLGGHRWGRTFEKARGCRHLEVPHGVTCTHAIAYHESIYDRVIEDIPASPSAVALWLRKQHGIDQYYARELDGLHLITSPIIATQQSIAKEEAQSFSA